jgi:hypothetical protein
MHECAFKIYQELLGILYGLGPNNSNRRVNTAGRLFVGRAPGSIWPHALACLAATLMGSWDPCLGKDSVVVNLLLVLQNWCS